MATRPGRPTPKTIIIENIFDKRWDSKTGRVTNDLVTLTDVSDAIRRFNRRIPSGMKPMSDRNPANFFKDFIRVTSSANRNWPNLFLPADTRHVKKPGQETLSDLLGFHPVTFQLSSRVKAITRKTRKRYVCLGSRV
jgi:hypothetical protein